MQTKLISLSASGRIPYRIISRPDLQRTQYEFEICEYKYDLLDLLQQCTAARWSRWSATLIAPTHCSFCRSTDLLRLFAYTWKAESGVRANNYVAPFSQRTKTFSSSIILRHLMLCCGSVLLLDWHTNWSRYQYESSVDVLCDRAVKFEISFSMGKNCFED